MPTARELRQAADQLDKIEVFDKLEGAQVNNIRIAVRTEGGGPGPGPRRGGDEIAVVLLPGDQNFQAVLDIVTGKATVEKEALQTAADAVLSAVQAEVKN